MIIVLSLWLRHEFTQSAAVSSARSNAWSEVLRRCSEMSHSLTMIYEAAFEPPAAPEARALHFRGMLAEFDRELGEYESETRTQALGDERAPLEDGIQRFRGDVADFAAEFQRPSPSDSGESPPLRDRFGALSDRFHSALGSYERLREKTRDVQMARAKAHSEAANRLESLEDVVQGLLLVAIGCTTFFLYRLARQMRADVRHKAALVSQLSDTDAKYRSIFDSAIEGIFQTTPEGRFITANAALAQMYGYRSPAHLMESLSDIGTQLYVDPEQRAALLEALAEEDVVSNFEFEAMRADGRTVWLRENVRAVRDEKGELLYLQGTVEDVSDRWWGEQRRRLQYATTRALSETATVAEARPKILQTICEILEWDMGAVWDVDAERMLLRCVEIWHTPDVDVAAFEEANSRTTYAVGEGLSGEVWKTGEPKWIADMVPDAQYPNVAIAITAGMGSAFGVPIKVGGEVLHVLEFFSPKISLPDPELLQTLGVIGSQLGHLLERKGAEEALRTSEMRKAAILKSSLDCIISFDSEGKITEFNPAAERLFGYSQDDALGRDMVELIIPETLRESHRRGLQLKDAASEIGPTIGRRMELSAMRSDGSEVPVEMSISRIVLGGTPVFTAYLRDITYRRDTQRITSELAAVVANSNDAIIACTLDGLIRSWNVAAERIYGYAAEEAVGRPLHMLLPPDRLDEFPRILTAVKRGESMADYETVRLRKDGKKISVSLTDSPMRGDEGKVTGLSSIARDITERKRLEEELLQSQKMDAVGRLAGGIAHDFNNILTAILGYSDLIMGQIDERQWMYKHLAEIRKAADFAAALTHQLLAFSRRQPLYLRVFDVNESVRNLQKMLQRVIGEHIEIKTALTSQAGRLKADPSQLEQVLLNLCVNARDAMPNGGSITIHTEEMSYVLDDGFSVNEMPAGEYVKLTVTDTGTGMSPEVMKHIFEPFFTTKEKGQGTGLGLATCYGIVKQSGGYIHVESTPEVGSSFSIYMPRVDESGVKANVKKDAGELPGGAETILYVEDEISVRSLTTHVLRRLGYTVIEAGDATSAREIVEAETSRPIDLLFSDVVLPDLGGKALSDWMRTRSARTKVLFTSGYVDEVILRRHGLESDSPFLQKPFTPSELARKVRDVFDVELAAGLKE